MSKRIKVGIVGAGVFAGYHASKVAAHNRAHLVGVFDPANEACHALAVRHGTQSFETLEALCAASDALIIASPARTHYKSAEAGLDHGCHLLIEKPYVLSVADGLSLTERAAALGRIIQVGHQERIVAQALGLFDIRERPLTITAARNSARATRNLDVSVVMDLMIHDIDLIHALMGAAPDSVSGSGQAIYSQYWDEASAELTYGAEASTGHKRAASLRASRHTAPERVMTITYPSGVISIDFLNKSVLNDTPFEINAEAFARPDVQDSLATAFDYFVRACLDGDPPLVSGNQGLAAVKTALAIQGNL